MKHAIQKLPKSTIEIKVDLSIEDMQPHLQKAAEQLSTQSTIPGFRPGKAPYEQVVARFGAQRIWEEAAQLAVPKIFHDLVKEQGFDTVGSPTIDVIKLAPDNPFVFKATVATMPEVTLGDYSKIKVEQKKPEIADKDVDRVAEDLRKMQTKEISVDRPTKPAGDKVVLDMDMSLDKVPIDGGTTKDHSVYMDEDYYIPGLKEQLHGVKKGETKKFQLKFPKEHQQKMIAGKDVDFQITVKEVYELQKPEIDDAFAKTIGKSSLKELKQLIRGNLEQDAKVKEGQRQEIELLEKMMEQTKYGDVPEILVNEEAHKMVQELEQNIMRQGMGFDDYLKKINKTKEQLRLDFAADAVKRVKIALAVRAIAAAQNITISDEEVEAEIKRILELYKDTPEQHEQIKSPGAREYLRNMLKNRKVIEWLRGQAGLQ